MNEVVSIGFGSIVMTKRIIAILQPETAPIKRIINEARTAGRLLDVTYGRRTRSVLVMDNGTIITSAVTPETIVLRANSPTPETSKPNDAARKSSGDDADEIL